MAAPHPIGEGRSLVRNGENAADVVKALDDASRHWIEERLGLIAKGIRQVASQSVLGMRLLAVSQQQGEVEQWFLADSVSQGTLRALGVLLALRQQPPPSLVLVDEIESSLHPNALAVLLDAALATAATMPVVLSTHSPEVLSHPSVTGERVRVVQWEDGVSRIYCLNEDTKAAINAIDTVGWMLQSNSLWTAAEPETVGDDFFALD
jgi:predicted ATPase